MKHLQATDFLTETIDGGRYHYYICVMGNGVQLCLEPAKFGYWVATYDINGVLLKQKRKIRWIRDMLSLTHARSNTTFEAAIACATALYEDVKSNPSFQMGNGSYYDNSKKVLTLC